MPGIQGMKRSRPTSQAHTDAILRSKIEKRLNKHFDGIEKLTPTQLKAGELLYDRLAPKLTAVEQTVVDARDNLDEATLLAELQGLFTAKPDLLDRLIQLRDSARLLQQGEQAIDSARARVETPSSTLSDPIAPSK